MSAESDRTGFDEIGPDDTDLQYRRLEKAVKIAELLESVFGENKIDREPYLSDESDETSNLIFDCDFGGDLQTQVNISLECRVIIYNQKILTLLLGARRMDLQDVIMGSHGPANDVTIGDC
jgi:hypothetical protein